MRLYNINANLIRTIECLYDKATSSVYHDNNIGEWFRTTIGVCQVYLLSPTLFNIFQERIEAVLNWAEHSVREQLCLLEMFKLSVWFLIDVFDLGEQLCSRPMGRRSDVRNVGSAGYGRMLLIG